MKYGILILCLMFSGSAFAGKALKALLHDGSKISITVVNKQKHFLDYIDSFLAPGSSEAAHMSWMTYKITEHCQQLANIDAATAKFACEVWIWGYSVTPDFQNPSDLKAEKISVDILNFEMSVLIADSSRTEILGDVKHTRKIVP